MVRIRGSGLAIALLVAVGACAHGAIDTGSGGFGGDDGGDEWHTGNIVDSGSDNGNSDDASATDDGSGPGDDSGGGGGNDSGNGPPDSGGNYSQGLCPNTQKYQSEYIQYAATASGCIHSTLECKPGQCCYPKVGLSGLCLPI